MMRVVMEIIAALAACAGSLVTGYFCWRVSQQQGSDIEPATVRRRLAICGFLPFWMGCVVGMGVLAAFSSRVFADDRFHSLSGALIIGFGVIFSGLLYLLVDCWMPPVFGTRSTVERRRLAPKMRLPAMIAAQITAATAVVLLGVRFPILSVGTEKILQLGSLALPATVAWLIIATLFVKLLDGLHGAALLLLLFASIAVCSTTAFTTEHFLNAYSAILIGAVIGALRFHLYPARLEQIGGSTAFVGFMFAVLTVLARQKTVAALLLLLPLVIVVLLVGGLFLGFLERNLLLKKSDEQGEQDL